MSGRHRPIQLGSRYRVPSVGIVRVIGLGRYRVTCLYGGGMVEISKAHLRSGWKLQPR